MAGLHELTIHETRGALLRKEASVTEVVTAYLERIEELDKSLNSYLTVLADQALEQARAYDSGTLPLQDKPLGGVPLALKDVLCTQGVRTTCGSRILENFIPPFDATAVARLKENGAILLGKTNMDEFAMGSSNENSAYGPVRNPWDMERVPGGSSGGSAAAVAADLCAGALGTDTGGSIRQPASFCGVVGMKPTYGRVSRYGLVAFASSLDQIGPITKDVRDAALLLQVVAGHDPRDSTCLEQPVGDLQARLDEPIRGMTLGIPKEYFVEGMDPEVARAMEEAFAVFRDLGARLVEISLPHTDYGVAAYYIIAPAEASSNLARYDGVKYGFRKQEARDLLTMYRESRNLGFGAEVKRRIMLGTYSLSAGYYDAYYRKASQVRTLIKQDFIQAFDNCDAIIAPVVPTPAFKIGEKTQDPLQMYLSDVLTLPASLAGIPGISVPCGHTSGGLPVGLQVLGPHFGEAVVLQLAHNFEKNTDHGNKKPSFP
ncbi:aspartyl/glutamyl-tRNA(Asn/Gln) amidotransferase subunit A [Desulfacinum infernum DSM 9756]|jgi:aspartyl-tRNA(Asn)/glutamyl-tRNA(Gln) amidotransferase subunit A|uniref:Glutamyl-tRNA(Gln) amidotransferase subunit A n=1 Tax=Desulfacinum infernum DSM 9756 TaxID=1121391 RepID=A0A1M5EB34_9BACT|nr:Asp-tRNA(Asn)/Glu-tRNA(Gln) amidotransferase subunit GatA [Desulfacinum infernum]SHF76407.1 aspartyl/glutamyl-tRNA(Asn/Gln) amidotransferase subunit A [Desulfacinum infernum DSM 9756]